MVTSIGSDAPSLLLSGNLDPVTPPSWGELVARGLPRSRHIVVPGAAHGTTSLGCIPELLADFLRRMEDKTPPNYLRWGIRQLDEVLTAEPGDFIVLGADSSVGKTALAVQLAWNMASRGRRVGFFSLEASARKLADRVVAQRARVELSRI